MITRNPWIYNPQPATHRSFELLIIWDFLLLGVKGKGSDALTVMILPLKIAFQGRKIPIYGVFIFRYQ